MDSAIAWSFLAVAVIVAGAAFIKKVISEYEEYLYKRSCGWQ